tara:strand:- start:5999 stop:8365 length:2367 start_codon:yes stop_codon:yes gene_type:complete
VKSLINKNILIKIFLLTCILLMGFGAFKIHSGPVIETNILALLPKDKNSDLLNYIDDKALKIFERTLVVLVGHSSVEHAVDIAQNMKKPLQNTNLFSRLRISVDSTTINSLLKFYQKHHYSLLTNTQKKILINKDFRAVRSHVLSNIYGNSFNPSHSDIDLDPLFFFQDYAREKIGLHSNNFILVNNVPTVFANNIHYAIIRLELTQSSFSINYQQQVLEALNNIQANILEKNNDVVFVRSGLIFHAIHGTEIAKAEINRIGSFSIIGVFLLLTLTFKSLRPFCISIISILLGGAIGFATCLIFFEKVHLLTLVFGTSLIGISVDYSLHFFSERYRLENWDSSHAVSNIFSGVTLGVITSIIGFLGLCFTPFPGLQQMAIFCIAGLLFVYACVVLIYPLIFQFMPNQPNKIHYILINKYLSWWNQKRVSIIRKFTVLFGIILLGTIPFLHGKDDVRAMQSLSPKLISNDNIIAKLLGNSKSSQFFVVIGKNDEDMLSKTSNLSFKLDNLIKNGTLSGYNSLSNYIPSKNQQTYNLLLMKNFLEHHKEKIKKLFVEIGLAENTYDKYLTNLTIKNGQNFSLQQLLSKPVSKKLGLLYAGDFKDKKVSFITLEHVKKISELHNLAHKEQNIIFVDKVFNLSKLLDNYRSLAILWLIGAYIIIFIIVLKRYGLIQGAAVIGPTFVASLLTLGLIVFIFGSYSLFHVLALFLVLGVGIDYGLFISENNGNKEPAMIAILLSAITTLLSFSMLMTSSTSALYDFGLTVSIGVIITFFLFPVIFNNKIGVIYNG